MAEQTGGHVPNALHPASPAHSEHAQSSLQATVLDSPYLWVKQQARHHEQPGADTHAFDHHDAVLADLVDAAHFQELGFIIVANVIQKRVGGDVCDLRQAWRDGRR